MYSKNTLLITDNLVIPSGRFHPLLFGPRDLKRICQLHASRNTGVPFSGQLPLFRETKILDQREMYPFSRPRARSIIASELSSKKTSFRAGAFSADFSRRVPFPQRCIPAERINRTRRCFSFDLPTCSITILAKISRELLWRCLQLHLSCVFATSLTKLLPLVSSLKSNSLRILEHHSKRTRKIKAATRIQNVMAF